MTTGVTATNADRTRWQRTALTMMTQAMDKGAKAGLPPLNWHLGATGCAGHVSTIGLTLAEQERQFRDWAAALGWPVTCSGRHLRAQEPVSESWMNPRIVIGVELYDWNDEGEV